MSGALTTSDGRRLAYRRSGVGPILVCHPGGPGAGGGYLGDLGGLDRSVTLVRLDPRGSGGSDRPADGSYRLEEYAADLDELRVHLGLERLNLLGHSHGGFVGMVYAATYPERVERLVLVGSLVRFGAGLRVELARTLETLARNPAYADAVAAHRARNAGSHAEDEELVRLLTRELPLYFGRYGEAEREFVEAFAREPRDTDALCFFNTEIAPTFDLRPLLSRVTAPTLVMAGEREIGGPLGAAEIAMGVAGSTTVLVPDAGHFPWVEQPERVRAELAAFLAAAT